MNNTIREASSTSVSVPPPNPPPSPPQSLPVGQENWLDYIEQQKPAAHDLDTRIHILDLYKKAVTAEPGSLRLWLEYCEYFWSLYRSALHPGHHAALAWGPDELPTARDIFSLDSALRLWQEGHEATKYRLGDSHELWNRWIAKEMELLAKTKTAEGVRRITHLFRNRLTVPQAAWNDTSQAFSRFLSEYNPSAWEDNMTEVTTRAKEARDLYAKREPHEQKLRQAATMGDAAAERAAMTDYLQFEIAQTIREKKRHEVSVNLALGLFSRALTGLLATDEPTWMDYVVFISTLYNRFSSPQTRDPDMLQVIPSNLSALQCAVQHCPWSGSLWARYILSGEEAGLSFSAIERIKHAATDSAQLDRDGMVAVIDMYAAWCGYLKRSAMDPAATEETTDIADSGLLAALEAVQVWGERRFGKAYVGDPNFRLERILIGYLTEKHGAIEEARSQWLRLAEKPLYAASYNFWVHFYVWELSVFQAEKGKGRSPTPGMAAAPPKLMVPTHATEVLQRALKRRDLDWPERIMEVYMQHCNDYESSETLRLAHDNVHRTSKLVAQRRQEEAAAAATYAAAASQPQETHEDAHDGSPSGPKRKREGDFLDAEGANKRPKNESDAASGDGDELSRPDMRRDREHTSVLITNLPGNTTQTRVKQYLRDYGHVNGIIFKKADQGRSSLAIVEFRTSEDARSALLRDGKYYEKNIISVKPATGLTLFVTNFPPTADEDYIRNIFKDCGEILDVRWPSLKYNTHRRFCYVTFRDQRAAQAASQLSGELLEGKYKLEAKPSDPSQKKARQGATSEGREVRVKNLPPNADEVAIKEIFEKYGKVVSVRILRNMAGKSQGAAYIVYETRQASDRSVAELNNANIRGRILTVENAKVTNFKPSSRMTASISPSPAPDSWGGSGADEEGDVKMVEEGQHNHHQAPSSSSSSREPRSLRTFALLGIPETVNDTRVRALVEKHGAVAKIVLRPDHGGAIVEMADPAATGKAQLALEGAELDGGRAVIRTGSVADLLGEKPGRGSTAITGDKANSAIATDPSSGSKPSSSPSGRRIGALMLPPRALGQKLPKRGLGLPMTIPGAANSRQPHPPNGDSGTANGPAPAVASGSKTNAQFRDLFLNSGGVAATDKETVEKKPIAAPNGQAAS